MTSSKSGQLKAELEAAKAAHSRTKKMGEAVLRAIAAAGQLAANAGMSAEVKKSWLKRQRTAGQGSADSGSKVKGEVWRNGDLTYFTDGRDVFTVTKGSVPDVHTGFHQGRWESTVEHWNVYAERLGRPKIAGTAANCSARGMLAKRKMGANNTSIAAASPSPMIGKYAKGAKQKSASNCDAENRSPIPGQKPHDVSQFDLAQLAAGTRVEKEHTSDPQLARQIAMDHLAEDPEYYRKLKRCVEN